MSGSCHEGAQPENALARERWALALAAAAASPAKCRPRRPRHRCSAGAGSISAPGGYDGAAGTPSRIQIFGEQCPTLTGISAKASSGASKPAPTGRPDPGRRAGDRPLGHRHQRRHAPTVAGGSYPSPHGGRDRVPNRQVRMARLGGRARLGYLVLPNVLFYGTAGPAWTRLVVTQSANFLASDVGTGMTRRRLRKSDPSWRSGAYAGAACWGQQLVGAA